MTIKQQIIGTWKLTSMEVCNAAGELSQLFGDKPEGILIYTDTGHISVQVINADRPHFVSGDFSDGTPEEFKAAFLGMSTYFGAYEIDDDGKATHYVQCGSFPNDCDTVLTRHIEVSGKKLTFGVPPMLIDGEEKSVTLFWERIEKISGD